MFKILDDSEILHCKHLNWRLHPEKLAVVTGTQSLDFSAQNFDNIFAKLRIFFSFCSVYNIFRISFDYFLWFLFKLLQ